MSRSLKALLPLVASTALVALAGTAFGVDFNPRADLLRIVSNTGQNLRVNLQAGRIIADVAREAGFQTHVGAGVGTHRTGRPARARLPARLGAGGAPDHATHTHDHPQQPAQPHGGGVDGR